MSICRKCLREAAHDPRRLEEYLDKIEQVDPAKLTQYEQATGIALARANVDFSGFQRANVESRGTPPHAALRRGAVR